MERATANHQITNQSPHELKRPLGGRVSHGQQRNRHLLADQRPPCPLPQIAASRSQTAPAGLQPLPPTGAAAHAARPPAQHSTTRVLLPLILCCVSYGTRATGALFTLPWDLSIRCLHPEPNASTRALRVLQIVLPLCQRVLLHTHLRDEQRRVAVLISGKALRVLELQTCASACFSFWSRSFT